MSWFLVRCCFYGGWITIAASFHWPLGVLIGGNLLIVGGFLFVTDPTTRVAK